MRAIPGLAILVTSLVATATLLPALKPDPGFIAHEWGTFTSVQGADGIQMEWNPLIAPDLPTFVYNSSNSAAPDNSLVIPGAGNANTSAKARVRNVAFLGKTGMTTRQRMETPVIYFYTDRERTVDVNVEFPHGTVTEWYPQRTAATNPLMRMPAAPGQPALRWPSLRLTPATHKAERDLLPNDNTKSHYYAARETGSALVQAQSDGATQTDKFLFYRGVASMQTPLTVTVDPHEKITLTNSGAEPLRHLFVYDAWKDGGTWTLIPELAPGEHRETSLSYSSATENQERWQELAPTLKTALEAEGLFAAEAAAMVKTWQDSWFQEPGLRVLYTLPRAWTDRELPIAMTPSPQKIERVMVARAEIIRPSSEAALVKLLDRYVATTVPAARADLVAQARALNLGRFLEPAMRRAMTPRPGEQRAPDYYSVSYEFLTAATAP